MTLIPKRPLGRSSRKALAFATEIARLHTHGYSCEAIRQTLSEAGLIVSRSTVTREVLRWAQKRRTDSPAAVVTPLVDRSVPLISTTQPASALAGGPHYGQRVAASFVDGRITNPLFRARTAHENSRH